MKQLPSKGRLKMIKPYYPKSESVTDLLPEGTRCDSIGYPSPHSSRITSGTVSIRSQRYALLPQKSSARSISPSAAWIRAFVIQ